MAFHVLADFCPMNYNNVVFFLNLLSRFSNSVVGCGSVGQQLNLLSSLANIIQLDCIPKQNYFINQQLRHGILFRTVYSKHTLNKEYIYMNSTKKQILP